MQASGTVKAWAEWTVRSPHTAQQLRPVHTSSSANRIHRSTVNSQRSAVLWTFNHELHVHNAIHWETEGEKITQRNRGLDHRETKGEKITQRDRRWEDTTEKQRVRRYHRQTEGEKIPQRNRGRDHRETEGEKITQRDRRWGDKFSETEGEKKNVAV